MPSAPWRRHALLQTAGVIGLAGAALGAGLMEGLTPPLDWAMAGGLALAAGAAAWMAWRGRPGRLGLGDLRLELNRPMDMAPTMDGVLRFATTAPMSWCARRGEWCLGLLRSGPEDLPWRMELRRADLPEESVPLAQAATLDAVLNLSRRLFAQQGLVRSGDSSLREAAELLECDMEFPLPTARSRMTALAEGGYALQDQDGFHPISAQLADRLLAQCTTVRG
ncbi:hypothetical protein NON00_17440 [Roseomonas sp. GC11]|uniref:hypothetical protein n=1 Tax=Roseomonas sp. GC11 TaxID=2950546 RepID=UPI00210A6786|nr:hypothetical protein [Roseomonas sp. GC11]MCQ4161701.1 hypothetical protein [Roseomonas sp. GC11]